MDIDASNAPDMQSVRDYFAHDLFARSLGIELVDLAPGQARVTMPIRETHYNSLRIVHGGAIFSLADFAFAVACNAYGQTAVGISASISFLKPTCMGTLAAEAQEVSRTNRLSTYIVRVMDDEQTVVAVFQGTAYRKNEPLASGGQ